MRREHAVVGVVAVVTLLAGSLLAFAQAGGSSGATRPGPTPGQSSGMPSDLDTTGMGGGHLGCVASPSGTSSTTGGDVRTPANAGDLQARRTADDPHVASGPATETSEPMAKSMAKPSGC